MTNSGSGAAAFGQQPGSSGASDANTSTTTGQQLVLMTKEIGAIQLQQAALQVWAD